MTSVTTTEPVTKRARRVSVILTERACQKRVAKREKVYDRKCSGLYVSVIPAGVATFNFKFTDKTTGKQRTKWLGIYCAGFTVDNAHTVVYALKHSIDNGQNFAHEQPHHKPPRPGLPPALTPPTT